VGDGLLLCKLINKAQPDTVDERALNSKPNMNVFQKNENLNLMVNSAKAIGCKVVNIGNNDMIEGTPHLVLGLVWQIVRIQLLSKIDLKNHPELVRLLEEVSWTFLVFCLYFDVSSTCMISSHIIYILM
jgi:plastin-1